MNPLTPQLPPPTNDQCPDHILSLEDFFNLSLPIPQTSEFRDGEILYWREYINTEFKDVDQLFCSQRNNHNSQASDMDIALEFEIRRRKVLGVRSIMAALERLTKFPLMGKQLSDLKDAYREWDCIERDIIELLLEDSKDDYAHTFYGEKSLSTPHQTHPNSSNRSSISVNPQQSPKFSRNILQTPPYSPQTKRDVPRAARPSKNSISCPEASCNLSFPRQNALMRHISSIHGKTGVSCPFCAPEHRERKFFNRSDNLQRHVISQHPGVRKDDRKLCIALDKLYLGKGVRTSWTKGGSKKQMKVRCGGQTSSEF